MLSITFHIINFTLSTGTQKIHYRILISTFRSKYCSVFNCPSIMESASFASQAVILHIIDFHHQHIYCMFYCQTAVHRHLHTELPLLDIYMFYQTLFRSLKYNSLISHIQDSPMLYKLTMLNRLRHTHIPTIAF